MNEIKYGEIIENVDKCSCPVAVMFWCIVATTCYEENERRDICLSCLMKTISMTKDTLIELLKIVQHNYECTNKCLFNIRQYAEKLNKALDIACDLLEKSKAGTTCDEENRKNCIENHCFNTCMYARNMNKEEWRDYLMKGENE